MKKSLKDKWTKLYDVASTICKLAPWKWIVEERLIVIKAYEGLEFYMSVMGMSGLFEGIMLCTSKSGIRNYNEMQCSRMPDLLGINYQEGILMVFNDEKICLKENVKLADEFMEKRINNKVITFESFVKGYLPSKLTEEELDDAILAFTTLEKALIEFDRIGKRNKNEYTDEVKKIRDIFLSDPRNALILSYDEDEDKLDIQTDLPKDIDDYLPSVMPPQDVLDEAKEFKRTNHVWEFELLNYLPIPIDEVNYKNPFMNETIKKTQIMRYVILADKTTNEIIRFSPYDKPLMSNKEEFDFIDTVINDFFNVLAERGLPKEIVVRDENTYTLLLEVTKELKIKLKQDALLDMCDDFLNGFFVHITGEDPSDFEGMNEEDFEEYLENMDDDYDEEDDDDDDDDNPFLEDYNDEDEDF